MRNAAPPQQEQQRPVALMLFAGKEAQVRSIIFSSLIFLFACQLAHAQSGTTRSSSQPRTLSGITGRYSLRSPSMENSLDVLLLAGGKIKVYLFASWIGSAATGNVNTGEIKTILPFKNGTALYESVGCRITIRFAGNKAIVDQAESGGDCGFGLNVSAEGTYKKRNGRTPKFDF